MKAEGLGIQYQLELTWEFEVSLSHMRTHLKNRDRTNKTWHGGTHL